MGNKVLRERLKGPALAAYYPRNSVTIADIQKEFKRYDLETWNEEEEDRLEGLQIAKLRGKGAPKKKRTADSTITHFKALHTSLTISQQARKARSGNDQRAHQPGIRDIYMIPCMKRNFTSTAAHGYSSGPHTPPQTLKR